MYNASAVGDAAGPGWSERDSAETGTGIIDDADRLEGVKNKVDITTLEKSNKIPILVSY